MASKIIKWVDQSLNKIERAAANARAAITARDIMEEKLHLSKSALLCVKACSEPDTKAYVVAVEALAKLEDI